VAKDNGNEFGLTLLEREIFPVRDAKEKVGPLRGNIFKHGRLGDNRKPTFKHENERI
jgi:hypothetical protein